MLKDGMQFLRTIVTILTIATSPSLLPALVVLQTYDLEAVLYDGPVAAPSNTDIPALIRTFQPFDSSLGMLDSVEIRWIAGIEAEITTPSDSSGSMRFGFGASYFINSYNFGGNGGGGGGGGPSNSTFNYSDSNDDTYTYLSTDTTDSATTIWGIVTGSTDFTLSHYASSDGYFGDYEFFTDLQDAYVGIPEGSSVSLTYNYTPVPEPSVYAVILGLACLVTSVCLRRRFKR